MSTPTRSVSEESPPTASPEDIPRRAGEVAEGTRIAVSLSPGFAEWISGAGGSLVISTYQANKVALIGWNGRQVTITMREFRKPMGVAGGRMALATFEEIILFANALLLAPDYLKPGQYDALYLPRAAYFTGELHTHDIAFGADGLWIVNTRFSCLCRVSDQFSFEPIWHPRFISQLAPEDRCHLNGLALRDNPIFGLPSMRDRFEHMTLPRVETLRSWGWDVRVYSNFTDAGTSFSGGDAQRWALAELTNIFARG